MNRAIIILLLLSCFRSDYLHAQRYTLDIFYSKENKDVSKLNYKKTFFSEIDRNKEIQKVLLTLNDNAYLTATVDSSQTDTLNKKIFINTGEQYQWAILKKGSTPENILSAVGFREKIYAGKPLYYKDVRKLQEKILAYCENNGHPFASIKLDSIIIDNNKLSATLNLEQNLLIRIDSVVNRGSAKISSTYLQSYLAIKNKSLYNESLIRKAGARIKVLPFVRERIPFRVLFPGEKAKIELFLEDKRASQFDGIVGLLPDNKTGKILFTGDVRLKLNSAFNYGELIELNWRRLQVSTQDLKSRIIFPFLFKSPFGIDASFKLYKKDTTFLDVNPNLGIQYHLSGENYFKVFVNQKTITLINTKGLENLVALPPYADISSTLYGLGAKFENLDYRFNPRKGYAMLATIGAGNKVIKKNDNLNPIIYENLNLKSAQYNTDVEADFYFPLKNRSTIKLGTKAAYIYNENLFQNELIRIGGLKTLRGFDEESIFASGYLILTLEYRYLLEENSYLYFFSDGAYYENLSITYSGDRYDTPIAFGAGISFETKAGIFSINYALGRQFSNDFDIRTGKVHFGIVNHF